MFSVSSPISSDVLNPIESKKQQLDKHYILPKLCQLKEQNNVWTTRLIGHGKQDQIITVSFRPYQAQNDDKHLTWSQFYLTEKNKKQLILQTLSEGIPISGSMSLSSVMLLAVTFQYEQQEIKYDTAVFYCAMLQGLIVYNRTSDKYQQYTNIKVNSPQAMQAHFIQKSLDQSESKQKPVKVFKRDIFQKSSHCERLLILVANQQAAEYNIEFDFLKLTGGLSQAESVQFIQESKKKFAVQLSQVSSFVQFSNNTEIQLIISREHVNVVYMSYNQQFQDYVYVTKEIKNAQTNSFYFKLHLYKLTPNYQPDQASLKILQTFTTTVIPIGKHYINPFDGLDLQQNVCRVTYLALSALNQLLTVEVINTDTKLLYLCFHLQTGSCTRLQATSPIAQIDNGDQLKGEQSLNAGAYATRIIRFLKQANLVVEFEQAAQYYKMYKFLVWRKYMSMSQPITLVFSYCALYIVPNLTDKTMTVHLIKALPYTPVECIFTQQLPLTKTNYYRRFIDYVNGDNEFIQCQVEEKIQTMYDFNIQNYPSEDISFSILPGQITENCDMTQPPTIALGSEIEYEDELSLMRMTSATSAELDTDSFINQDDLEMTQEPVQTQNENMSPRRTRNFSSSLNFSVMEDKIMFTNEDTLPLFTGNDAALYYAISNQFSNKYILHKTNMLIFQSRFQPLYRESNNIFQVIEFHKCLNNVLIQYEDNPMKEYYDMPQFAIIMTLFQAQVFDNMDPSVKEVVFHPQYLINKFYEQIPKLDVQQKHLSKIFVFISDLVQQCSQLYQMQVNELLSILRAVIGKDLYELINNQFSTNQQTNKLVSVQPLIDYFISKLSKANSLASYQLSPSLLLSIYKLSTTIMRLLQSADVHTYAITPQCLEFYIADYMYFYTLMTNLVKTKHHVLRMTSLVNFIDYSDKKLNHPLAKQYAYNQYIQQTLLKQFLEADPQFLKVLFNPSNAFSSYQELVYFRIFDKSLNKITMALFDRSKAVTNLLLESSSGSTIMSSIGSILSVIVGNIYRSIQDENRYHTLFAGNFANQTDTVLELIELINIKTPSKHYEIPLWLKQQVLREFAALNIPEQANFYFTDQATELNPIQDIIDAHPTLLFNKSSFVNVHELKYFSQATNPFQMVQKQNAVENQAEPQQMSLFQTAHNRFVAQAKNFVQKTQKPKTEISTLNQAWALLRYETAYRIADANFSLNYSFRTDNEKIIRTFTKQRDMEYFSPVFCSITKRRIQEKFMDDIWGFQTLPTMKEQEAYDRDKKNQTILMLSTRSLQNYANGLDVVGLYCSEYLKKRDLKLFCEVREHRQYSIPELVKAILE
ncbi:Conserved_hypothetical protein [Hexamita inflata]|uniref:Uncharacterized protein n=1 Tax=Hexamita inflata TaxID=28002 RepID=A0ABP1HRR7_9EUKA